MKLLEQYNGIEIYRLDKEIAIRYSLDILNLLKLIPKSKYKLEDIVSDVKKDRIMYGKWDYSLIAIKEQRLVGVLIGYERKKDGVYLENCFYINEIAVCIHKIGLGKKLIEMFLENSKYFYLDGDLKFRIQTEDSYENRKVIKLYHSIGFVNVGKKVYKEKTDLILEK